MLRLLRAPIRGKSGRCSGGECRAQVWISAV